MARSKPKGGRFYSRDSKTGRWRKKRADRSAGTTAREIRSGFKKSGRRFSDSTDIIRRDRDAG